MRSSGMGRAIWTLARKMPPTRVINSSLQSINYSEGGEKKQKLLRYHVLQLEETMARFMLTVKPLLSKKELKKTETIVKDFMKKPGKELQELLQEAGGEEKNWLAHRWLKVAYLQYRDPVTAWVSPCMTFPVQKFTNQEEYLEYIAKVMYGLGEFRNLVYEGKIPVLKMGKHELDNGQFKKVFGTCRIPKRITDEIVYNEESKHVVVMHKNHFFRMALFSNDCKVIAVKVLYHQLLQIMETLKNAEPAPPVGILTTDSRDNWAEAYSHLAKPKGNKKILKEIQKALFTVHLDQTTRLPKGEERNQLALQLIHGGGSEINSANRWMDKTIQLVINPNGNVGFTYEHSPAEGQPIAMMMDYVAQTMKDNPEFGQCGAFDNFDKLKKMNFSINPCVEQWLQFSKRNINKLVGNLAVHVLKFDVYGKEYIKSKKLGPDSYIQMALQLAYFMMYSKPAAQYESAHLRIFDGGRTETIRSCSVESLAFCEAMTGGKGDRAKALRAAVNGHQKYTRLALQGKGVDRHLFGLRMMAIENNKPIPEFFESKAFVKSSHFLISTSQVATKYEAFMAYGPSVLDGYGCCYNPRDCDIILAVSAWRNSKCSNLQKFVSALKIAFQRMKQVLDAAEKDEKCAKEAKK